MTSQEKRYSDHSFETSKVIVFLAGVKAKSSQCKWQRIQGVLAHLFFQQTYSESFYYGSFETIIIMVQGK